MRKQNQKAGKSEAFCKHEGALLSLGTQAEAGFVGRDSQYKPSSAIAKLCSAHKHTALLSADAHAAS